MKDTEKGLKRELCKHFEGQSQRLSMLAKLVLSNSISNCNFLFLAVLTTRVII